MNVLNSDFSSLYGRKRPYVLRTFSVNENNETDYCRLKRGILLTSKNNEFG